MVQAQPTVRRLTRGLGGARTAFQTAVRVAKVQAREVALMLSVSATAPVRLIRSDYETANAVGSQQPSRAAAQPPVLLVHGFGGGKSSWSSVARALRARGLSVDAMAYAPAGNSVEQLAGRLVDHVQTMLFSTGAAKVHLVGHSLGGVIIAQAISDPRLRGRVDTVITLGSPFGGSPWADALPVVDMVRALRAGSPLLSRLASTPLPEGVRWLSVTAALDIVVPGLRSVPPHRQAETVTISGVGHLGMLLSPQVIRYITAALCAEPSATDAALAVLQNAS
ncbi:hypothetical protein A5712_23900 [Mycobacterium sp. E2327]|uniref:esterase/lipase family protein n=1 Tax=Mycobacterium sp. E2327 TaxID=1834132 RepID=UPI0007FCC560|nr:alpha/beta fold hydrolase [Mycobacterium sp. E2327]OBI17488.1 hypothetical protein A5712_23900 [Mycobacterium sp. E2327]